MSVWLMIISISGALICFEAASSFSAMATGFMMSRPPWRVGRENSLLSSGEHGSRPVSAGMNCWCIAFSRG